ncbi:MAG: NHL repeat-containing protein [Thermoplasmata archaeon]|uniref:NHL repeat-containing protein n=1 Tax=Candidatus Sysuiplasma superficiale TaxID=2823368 RepID=A0A8J7YUK8_9ARCH|nr:NHL repeat-containing protein [Candidatus Sysuiplasma superficiale]
MPLNGTQVVRRALPPPAAVRKFLNFNNVVVKADFLTRTKKKAAGMRKLALFFLCFSLVIVAVDPQPSATYVVGTGTITPWSMSVDPSSGDLYVADMPRNRVLRYTEDNGFTSAVSVLGQPNITTVLVSVLPTPSSLYNPQDLFIDSQLYLWVADTNNQRVLRFSPSSKTQNGSNADGVFGQPNFSSQNIDYPQESAATLAGPTSVFVDSEGTLWVSDMGNNRVLRLLNALNRANGSAADTELCQPSFNVSYEGCSPSMANGTGVVTVSPQGEVFVTDQNNNRVVRENLQA